MSKCEERGLPTRMATGVFVIVEEKNNVEWMWKRVIGVEGRLECVYGKVRLGSFRIECVNFGVSKVSL